ncbi:glycosyltransferase family 2 protein [Actinomadura graeca]|uniref:Glycosyltransferase family 2 protein n=1 Tax=Actinomadura graeca TaxID=2750812 RepID=A0ABX8QU26_9ACTN|nr:glycosyltransferase family 2 protein [Actinomadura graeca]QXJ20288.1 glycosyltransferase family 2 protein [Actinomadura graeca]
MRAARDGVVVVMPAYHEAENLAATVRDFLTTLEGAGHDHRIVVVDDGSADATGRVLDDLVERYPDRVIGARHERNRGYGAAVRTGISVALARTDLRLLLLTDSDGQFKAADLPAMLLARREQRADAVTGFRRRRADPPARRAGGRLWTLVSRLLLGTRSRDVDCAYKLLDRWLLEDLVLVGDAAAIDPELLAKIGKRGARVIEHPVDHHPRVHGRPTGASPWVIARSLLSLARVHRGLVRDGHGLRWARWAFDPGDPVLTLVTLAAAVLSAGALLHHLGLGTVLAYDDAVSHLLIARRVIDSPTAGAAQLGAVWLPLPHLLDLPLTWQDALFHSGLGGTAISALGYVITVRYVYLIALWMAAGHTRPAPRPRDRAAGAAAAGLFALNANVLYMQSTPMTELLLFACIAAAVHHLQAWCHGGRLPRLAMASAATAAATLTRYEGWLLAVAVLAVVGYTALRRRKGYAYLEAHLAFFAIVAFSGIAAWTGWAYVIFGDPFFWYSGEYAKPSNWVMAGDENVGALAASARTYAMAVVHDLGYPALAAALAGLAAYGWRLRLRPSAVAPYVLLVFAPFFVYALFSGQRPLHVPEVHGHFYNVRFGLVMALAVAVFAGYPVSLLPSRPRMLGRVRAAAAAAVAATVVAVPGTATLAEPLGWKDAAPGQRARDAARWLRAHYDGGTVLMENHGNEQVAFGSRVPMGRVLYEGSFRLWERALADPADSRVRWIYARTLAGSPDRTWRTLRGDPSALRGYALVYQDADQRVYRRAGTP